MRQMIILIALITSTEAAATIHTGVGYTAWDFSEAKTQDMQGPWDFGTGITANLQLIPTDLFVWANSSLGAAIVIMPADVEFDSLLFAPADESMYVDSEWYAPDRVWVVRTIEGNYAKVHFQNDNGPYVFDYAYQDNGSRALDPSVPVDESTWGAIKALYR